MTRAEILADAAEKFGRYSNEKELHYTSDNQAFFKKNDADNHAKTLEDKEITLISRSDTRNVSNGEQSTEDAGTEEPVAAKKTAAPAKAAAGTKTQAKATNTKAAAPAKTAKADTKAKPAPAPAAEPKANEGDKANETETGEGDNGADTNQGGEQ